MKRTAIWLSALILVTSVALISCDAMFNTNIFAKATHPTPSAEEIAAKSPQDLQKMTQSATSLKQLEEDSALKQAALDNLADYYGGSADMTSVNAQVAAVTAADIAVKTDPSAVGLSGSILVYLSSGKDISTQTTTDITELVAQIMPDDISASITNAEPTPPPAFVDMIIAFSEANAAYQALGAGVGSTGYAAGTDISDSVKSDIAVNAMIAGLIMAITPMDPDTGDQRASTPSNVAEALWTALIGTSTLYSSISIDPATFDNLTSAGSPVSNLLDASSLGALFTPTTGGI